MVAWSRGRMTWWWRWWRWWRWVLGVWSSANPSSVQRAPHGQEDPEKAQWYLIYLLTFSALRAWFFHTGLFLTTISGAVSQWYFYRADPDDEDRACIAKGRPSFARHLGVPEVYSQEGHPWGTCWGRL